MKHFFIAILLGCNLHTIAQHYAVEIAEQKLVAGVPFQINLRPFKNNQFQLKIGDSLGSFLVIQKPDTIPQKNAASDLKCTLLALDTGRFLLPYPKYVNSKGAKIYITIFAALDSTLQYAPPKEIIDLLAPITPAASWKWLFLLPAMAILLAAYYWYNRKMKPKSNSSSSLKATVSLDQQLLELRQKWETDTIDAATLGMHLQQIIKKLAGISPNGFDLFLQQRLKKNLPASAVQLALNGMKQSNSWRFGKKTPTLSEGNQIIENVATCYRQQLKH